jgi:hypothetical protein
MPAQIGRFSTVASVRVFPDCGSCAICGGPFSAITPKAGFGLLTPQSSTVVTTTRTGELDGAKDVDCG